MAETAALACTSTHDRYLVVKFVPDPENPPVAVLLPMAPALYDALSVFAALPLEECTPTRAGELLRGVGVDFTITNPHKH